MNTYYHYQGFVYGPVDKPDPEEDTFFLKDFHDFVLINPKHKWTGPPLEDWQPLIEGRDFKLDTYRPETEEEYNEAVREQSTELNHPCRKKQLFAYPINQ